jgi:hypothetical protein
MVEVSAMQVTSRSRQQAQLSVLLDSVGFLHLNLEHEEGMFLKIF